MTVPEPPFLEHYLLENPWPAVVMLFVASVALFVRASRTHAKRDWRLCAGALGLAVAVAVLAAAVETRRERLNKQTRRVVQLTAPLNAQTLQAYFAPGMVIAGPTGSTWLPAPMVMPALRAALSRWQVQSHWVTETRTQMTGDDTGVTFVHVRSVIKHHAAGERPVHTEWLMHWRRDGQGVWRLEKVQWLEVQNRRPQQDMIN